MKDRGAAPAIGKLSFPIDPDWPKYRALYHTSTSELAEIARQTQPGLLILYHRTGAQTRLPDEQYLNEVRQGWEGKVVVGHDLEVY